jgi:hypothetical protein
MIEESLFNIKICLYMLNPKYLGLSMYSLIKNKHTKTF